MRAARTPFFGLEGRPCIARGKPRFAAPPRVHVPENMTGEPTTACQTGGLRARHRPRTASRAFDGAIHTEAWPGPVATQQGSARGGLGDCRSYSWPWARPRCAGRWLTRGGAAKRGLPRATMKPPRCGSEHLRACVHNGFAIGDRPCETVHPWNKYRNRNQGGLFCPFTSPVTTSTTPLINFPICSSSGIWIRHYAVISSLR
jgi:hypothetical protein